MAAPKPLSLGQVLLAVVTPLASIFGSGFLILTPILEQTLGAWSVFGVAGVCAVAWVVGTAVRHNIRVAEPLAEADALDRFTLGLENISNWVIVVAYVISVALYLRIMAQYTISYLMPDGSILGERLVACLAVGLIMVVGVTRGFHGLEILDRVALGAVLSLIIVLGSALLWHDIGTLRSGQLRLPPVPDIGVGSALLVLGGIVITVQGFETVRYLGDQYSAPTRIWASRLAQGLATVIYLGFVAVATPVMGLGTAEGADETLLAITSRVLPVLTVPLVLAAVFSQLSAAVADTAAADENLRVLSRWMKGHRPYLVSGILAVVLAATIPTFTIVTVASRAFAAYYGLQCLVAWRTCRGRARKTGYGALALGMFAIAVLAEPAG